MLSFVDVLLLTLMSSLSIRVDFFLCVLLLLLPSVASVDVLRLPCFALSSVLYVLIHPSVASVDVLRLPCFALSSVLYVLIHHHLTFETFGPQNEIYSCHLM